MKQILKHLFLGKERKGRRIPFGLYQGLTLSIDPRTDMSFYLGFYERETMPWLRAAGRTARSLIDVGAGCGELSIWGLAHTTMERVVAYDSSPERWHLFHENVRLNGFDHDPRLVTVEEKFLGGEHREVADEVFGDLPEPILLKVDVDGGEQSILEKMQNSLLHKRFLVLIETHSKELDEVCFQILTEAQYSAVRITPAWWRIILPEYRPLPFNQWIVAEPR